MSGIEKEEKEKWYPGKLLGVKKDPPKGSNSSNKLSKQGGDSYSEKESFDNSSSRKSDDLLAASSANNDPTSSESSAVKKAQEREKIFASASILGKVKVTLREFRYVLGFKNPGVAVSVENTTEKINRISDIAPGKEFEFEFDFREITSDIVLFFYEDLQQKLENKQAVEPCGRIVLPFSAYFGSTSVLPPAYEWRLIFPLQFNSKTFLGPYHIKYRSGLEEISDSGMIRPKISLGLVNLKVEFTLNAPLLKLYLSDGLLRYNNKERKNMEQIVEKEQNYKVAIQKVYRDFKRIQRIFAAPTIIAQFLTFPEIFILIGVFYCICSSARSCTIPLFLTIIAYLNGVVSNSSRSFANVIVWNNPVIMTRITNLKEGSKIEDEEVDLMRPNSAKKELSIAALQPAFRDFLLSMQDYASYWSTTLEKWVNLWTFGDARLSNLLFGVSFALSFVSIFGIIIFKWHRFVFTVGSFILFYLTFFDQVTETLNFGVTPAGATAPAAANNSNEPKTKAEKVRDVIVLLFEKFIQFIRATENVWIRIPDELELEHRFIASLSLVKEHGSEMQDAEDNWNAIKKTGASAN